MLVYIERESWFLFARGINRTLDGIYVSFQLINPAPEEEITSETERDSSNWYCWETITSYWDPATSPTQLPPFLTIQNGEIWENLPMALLLFCGQSLQVQDLLNSSLPLTWKVAMLKINLQRLQWKA